MAASFDEVLGYVQSLAGSPGFTGTLTITYRSPTPLFEDLEIRCEIDGQEGRKTFAAGRIYAGDRMCAEAKAIFIAARPEVFQDLLEARKRREAASES